MPGQSAMQLSIVSGASQTSSPQTGFRGGGEDALRSNDAAACVAAALLTGRSDGADGCWILVPEWTTSTMATQASDAQAAMCILSGSFPWFARAAACPSSGRRTSLISLRFASAGGPPASYSTLFFLLRYRTRGQGW